MGVIAGTDAHTIGILYDGGNLQFVSEDPWDWDTEFETSVSVGDVTNAVEDGGFPTIMIGGSKELLNNLAQYRKQTHAVFNLTGKPAIAGVLEAAGMNCVGSSMETLAVAASNSQAKYNAAAHNIRTPEFVLVSDADAMRQDEIPEYPVILKLARGSAGINEKTKVCDFVDLKNRARYMIRTYGQEVLVERFISGPEYDVPIIGNNPSDVFGMVEVVLNGKSLGGNYIAPKIAYKDDYGFDVIDVVDGLPECKRMALKAYNSLHCRDFGSVRIRTEESTGRPYLLRLDACPYVGKHGTFNHAARICGMKYKDMIAGIINSMLQRCG